MIRKPVQPVRATLKTQLHTPRGFEPRGARRIASLRLLNLFALSMLFAVPPSIAADELPAYLRDRGPGIRTSIFGTYVRHREVLVSPFVEFYIDDDFEYKPAELGYDLDQDFFGKYRATEGLLFLAWGVTDRLAIEFEAAAITAELTTGRDDPSTPEKISQSGLGDVQMQLDYTVLKETATRPEVFSYFEVVFPSNKDELLIGTSDFELKAGGGVTRGFRWGTVTGRLSVAHARSEGTTELGEWAFEYLKRISPKWRVYGGVEGTQDEVELILEAQWHVSDRVYLRFNNGFGLTAKATDFAPDLGIVFSFGGR